MPRRPCLITECLNTVQFAQHRGLCPACHKEAKALVDTGRTSWEELAEAGLAEAPQTPFRTALRARGLHIKGGTDAES